MSELQREFLRAKLKHLPLEPPMPRNAPPHLQILPEASDEGDASELRDRFDDLGSSSPDTLHLPPSPSSSASSQSSASSAGTIRPSLFARPAHRPRQKQTYEPISWNAHFSLSLHLPTLDNSATYHIYITPPTPGGVLFVAHHGAGSSGLSFALLASEIRKLIPAAGVLSFDCRGHGETQTSDDADLSLSTLSADLVTVLNLTRAHMAWSSLPDVVLVGHSLGGAVVADVAKGGKLGNHVLGYAVLDVVEGSAIDALKSMETYLETRPSGFTSLSQGIEWHTRSRTLRNPTSARISVPGLLMETDSAGGRPWSWRTDLAKTQPFWENWFVGLSKKFLEAKGGKLLILAGTDRLDKELMIGQMQGKYQLIVMPEVGHFVHEDAPEKTASALVEFYKRNDRSALVLPPKVSALMKQH